MKKEDELYDNIVKAYTQIREDQGGEKFIALLSQDRLLSAVKDVDIKEASTALRSQKYPKRYLGLTVDLALQAGVSLGGEQSPHSEPAVSMVSLLLDAKADPNDRVHLGYGRGRNSFLKEAISPRQNNKMVKVLLDRGAKQDLPSPGPTSCLQSIFMDETLCPVKAWHLFVATSFNLEAFPLQDALTRVITKQEVEVFIFFKAINTFFVSQVRYPVIYKALSFLPLVLADIIRGYSDDWQITSDDIVTNMSSEPREWQPLPADDLWFACAKKAAWLNQPFSPKFSDQLKIYPNREIGILDCVKEQVVKLFFPPLMFAAGMGNLAQVNMLIEAKADPTVTLNGNTALIWALHGGRQAHVGVAHSLCSHLIKERDSASNSCIIA